MFCSPVLPVGPSRNAKKFLLLSVCDDEVLSTPNTTRSPSPSNAFPQSLKVYLLLTASLTNLTVPNKQFFSGKLLLGLRGQLFNS